MGDLDVRRRLLRGVAYALTAPLQAMPSPRKEPGLALRPGRLETVRHRTCWIECGPTTGPLMIFVHGWPELGLLWRAQLAHFGRAGWRCVAPDMRGYGASSMPRDVSAYALQEIVADMCELHDALGASPAIWIGHDWGSPVASALAAHHPARCRGLVDISVPYFPRGFALSELVPLVDRALYPIAEFPQGQWDYMLYYQRHPDRAAREFEADVEATLATIFRAGSPQAVGHPAPTARVNAQGGRFGSAHRAPPTHRDPALLTQDDFDALVAAFRANGFSGPDAWYLNDTANVAYCAAAPRSGRIAQPVLFVNGAWDPICDISRSRLGEPMRAACVDLAVASIDGGHWLMLEQPTRVNHEIEGWLKSKSLQ